MTKREKQKIQKQLLNKLAEVTGSTAKRDGLIAERLNDPMDQVQSRADLDLTVSTFNTHFATKRAIQTALDLLETDEYGICQECGEPINPKRLQAIPWTTLCISCQEQFDMDRQLDQETPLKAA